jgi:arylsulfatase A-like enzyme
VLLLAWQLALAPTLAAAAPVVILISLDGVRHDYLDRDGLPAFARVAREGARAEALLPVFPASTFSNHVSLVTGARTERHGIVGNRFHDAELGDFDYDNDARFVEAEPLWASAERQGVRAAAFFWVASETDWRGVGASYRRAPFDGRIGEAEKVRQILAWLDMPGEERPGLIVSWWHGADAAGHRHGPDADETREQLRGQDAQLGALLAGLDARELWAETTLMLVSDHGMTTLGETRDVRALLREAGIEARVFHAFALANVHLADRSERDRAIAVLDAEPGIRAYAADAVPESLGYRHRRVGDLVALAEPPLALLRSWGELDRWRRFSSTWGGKVGGHGYDPQQHPDMRGIFLAMGRGAAPGARLPRVRTIDVAPTISELLGIAPPAQCEGSPFALSAAGSKSAVTEAPAATSVP